MKRIDPDHDAKLANKVLIAKKKSIEEGAERFRRDLSHNLSNHLVSSTVHGVMSDDVALFFNLLTTAQFWATMAYLSREYWKRFIICNGASSSSISDLSSCFHWDLNKPLIIADKELEARE
ncbi:hypothetical protein DY000_02017810 [Brassica cretica]|uniref:Uncharacterized protein n=1 Tax=Brassica cretica TaxID=69181 RepID=A0ABQ7D0G3_BRACR|nr:hypothetical protein DY000_02017810 [Brassica cretica]